jgi:uncharacterized protein YutE (UPF0331/DUF86 family)
MVSRFTPTERRRLNAVARDYTDKGYRVVKEPGPDALPDFLAEFRPAIIARGEDENVVVAIKTVGTLPQSRDLVPLAEAVDTRPDWRLELIVVKPAEDRSATVLDRWEIKHRLADARELLNDQEVAALLLASATAEAALHLIAQRNDVRLNSTERSTPVAALKYLYSLGLVGNAEYEAIESGMGLRNYIVHHSGTAELIRDDVMRLIDSVEHLLAEVPEQLAS